MTALLPAMYIFWFRDTYDLKLASYGIKLFLRRFVFSFVCFLAYHTTVLWVWHI